MSDPFYVEYFWGAAGITLGLMIAWVVARLALKTYKIGPSLDEDEPTPAPEPVAPPEPVSSPSLALQVYAEAIKWLGKDASPRNLAPQELACAESVSNILNKVIPDFPTDIISTATLVGCLDDSEHFERTETFAPGNVIVSPRTADQYGHAGICLEEGRIASNDSQGGRFEDNYSWDGWIRAFKIKRGLHLLMWKAINNGVS